MLNYLLSFDSYGEPIKVNYKGNSSYQTIVGAILSILASLLILAYALVQLEMLISRSNASVSVTGEFEDYASADDSYSLEESELGVLLRFQMVSEDGTIKTLDDIDPKYGRVAAF